MQQVCSQPIKSLISAPARFFGRALKKYECSYRKTFSEVADKIVGRDQIEYITPNRVEGEESKCENLHIISVFC